MNLQTVFTLPSEYTGLFHTLTIFQCDLFIRQYVTESNLGQVENGQAITKPTSKQTNRQKNNSTQLTEMKTW